MLKAIRGGLTSNRTFSYLAASYRIVDCISPSHRDVGQKRYADFFEAYIGAAWISACETKDARHITEVEYFLSQLFKPRSWPALESLIKGNVGLPGPVQLEQGLDCASDEEAGDISIFDVPPVVLGQTGKGAGHWKRSKWIQKISRRARAEIQAQASLKVREKRKALRDMASPLRRGTTPSKRGTTPTKKRSTSSKATGTSYDNAIAL